MHHKWTLLFKLAFAFSLLFPFGINAAEPGKAKLQVVSYNIRGLPSFAVGTQYKNTRYPIIGRLLGNPKVRTDIAVLQEAFDGETSELLEAAGFPHVAEGPGANSLLGANSGLYILSRYPIKEQAAIAFGSVLCSSWDCFANKGAQFVQLDVPGLPRPLEIFNTHLQSGRDDTSVRQRQARMLVEFYKKHHEAGNPVIFAGDFNFRPGLKQKSYLEFAKGTGLAHAGKFCIDSGCSRTPDTTWHGIWERAVDHQFYSQSGAVKIVPLLVQRTYREPVDDHILSDHPAHEVQYELHWSETRLADEKRVFPD